MADVISVSALNAYVKTLLENDAVLTDIAISGEISNFTHHIKTGHYYFTIKDEVCSVKCVMFRTYASRINFEPANGLSVIIRGQITLYEQQGSFQINADSMFLHGAGAIQAAFDKLKTKLEKQGLFDEEHKKQLPEFPSNVGLITSKTGAALQDILNVTKRRNPNANFLLCSTNVQGESAASEIVNAIKKLDSIKKCDVIIIARGGGSKEDLWVFNNEQIAMAAFKCKTPIVSAIGHEIDFCILDYVADMRAPTPSAAAEIVMPNMQSEIEQLNILFENIKLYALSNVDACVNKFKTQQDNTVLKHFLQYPTQQAQNINDLKVLIKKTVNQKMQESKKGIKHYASLGESLNPYSVLARGYSIVKKDKAVIKNAKQVSVNDDITVNLHKGKIYCKIIKTEGEA